MKSTPMLSIAVIATLCIVGASRLGAAAERPEPISAGSLETYPYVVNGLITTSQGTGSAVVVYHARTAVSAAHIVFDKSDRFDPWLNDARFHSRYHSSSPPGFGSGVPLAGFRYYTAYSQAVRQQGPNSAAAFHLDMVVHYGYQDLASGAWAGWFTHGDGILGSGSYQKLITGYPSGLYGSGHPYKYLMHRTGPIGWAMRRLHGSYFHASGASTGPGNSGGPVFARSSDGSEWRVAGILVSGRSKLLGEPGDDFGVRAMDKNAWKVVKKAIPDDVRPWVSVVSPVESSPKRWLFSGTASDDQLVDWVKVRVVRSGGSSKKWNEKKSKWVLASTSGSRQSQSWSAALTVPKSGPFVLKVKAHDRKNKSLLSETNFSNDPG